MSPPSVGAQVTQPAPVLSSLSRAINLCKTLSLIAPSLEKAELQNRISDVVNHLIDAEKAVAALKEDIQKKDEEIKRLKEA